MKQKILKLIKNNEDSQRTAKKILKVIGIKDDDISFIKHDLIVFDVLLEYLNKNKFEFVTDNGSGKWSVISKEDSIYVDGDMVDWLLEFKKWCDES